MKTIGVEELRRRAAEVVEDVRAGTEHTLVLQGSRKAAYLVGADQYEADQAELRATRRALFLGEGGRRRPSTPRALSATTTTSRP